MLLAGAESFWIFGLLISGGIVMATAATVGWRRARARKRSVVNDGGHAPPAWDTIPPTVGLAAQPDPYFRKHRSRRDQAP